MAGIVFDRLDEDLPTGETLIVDLYTMKSGRQMTAVVASDQEVTFWITYGRGGDDYAALPFKSGVVTVPAGETRGLVVAIMAGTEIGRLTINNASGSTAAVVADCGTV